MNRPNSHPIASSSYYLSHRQELSQAFAEILNGATQFWVPEFGLKKSQEMAQEALALFDRLLPDLPDVGGEKNWCTPFIPIAAWYVALYAPMRGNGKTAEDVGKLVYDLHKTMLQYIPQSKLHQEGENMFKPESMIEMRDWASWSQEREYPANWAAQFIQGNGVEFDFGYDYSECGVVKYLKAQAVPELAPYVCLNDFPKSAAMGSGLQRKTTLAQGNKICDFRYKKGRPVTQDWSTEIAIIKSGSNER